MKGWMILVRESMLGREGRRQQDAKRVAQFIQRGQRIVILPFALYRKRLFFVNAYIFCSTSLCRVTRGRRNKIRR